MVVKGLREGPRLLRSSVRSHYLFLRDHNQSISRRVDVSDEIGVIEFMIS